MRFAKLALAVFGFATVLVAADPFVGTWKLDAARSKCTTGAPNKELTVTISESGTDLDISTNGSTADGAAISNHYSVPAKGGAGKIIASPSPYDAVSAQRPGTNHRVATWSKGGKVVYTTHSRISADGKTITTTSKGSNPAGQQVDCTTVLEKQ